MEPLSVAILDQYDSVRVVLGSLTIAAGRYRILNRDGTSPTSSNGTEFSVSAVGQGTDGIVVRTIDSIDVHRAIKLMIPERGRRLFDPALHEIRMTNARPFKHVLAITDSGTDTDADGRQFGFYVSHFISGRNLADVFKVRLIQAATVVESSVVVRHELHDLLLALIDDALAGIVELQEARVVHMDIKPANLLVLPKADPMIRESIDLRRDGLFIADLGAAKAIQPGRTGPTPRQRTPYYFPEQLVGDLGDGTSFLLERLEPYWDVIDLYGLGRSLEEIVLDRVRRRTSRYERNPASEKQEREKEHLWRLVLEDDFALVEGLIERLLNVIADRIPATTLRLMFNAIPQRTSTRILDSGPVTDQYVGVRIRLGQALVRVAPPFDEIVAHPTFQRLRRLNQLSFISEIFPDATHTRFAHSLETFDLAKKFILHLNKNADFRLLFSRRDVEQVLLSALLHDVGQYHFSHTIEDLRKLGELCKSRGESPVLTTILHDEERIRVVLEDVQPVRGGDATSISTILRKYDYSIEDICTMVGKGPKDWGAPNADVLNCGRDMVSGVIDVDRISYLLNDSDRTGVPYGAAVDVGGLLESLTIHWDSRAVGEDRIALAIESGGVSMVEALLTAVHWMYRNVYWRHTNRAFMAAVKYVMRQLLTHNALTFERYVRDVHSITDWEALRYLYNHYQQLIGVGPLVAVNPLAGLIALQRLGYRRVFTLAYRASTDDGGLYDRLVHGLSPKREDALLEDIGRTLPNASSPKAGEILLDVPLKRRLKNARIKSALRETTGDAALRQKVLVCCRHPLTREIKEWVDLYDYSVLANHLGEMEDTAGRKIRLFMSIELLDRIPQSQKRDIEATLRQTIDRHSRLWEKDDEQATTGARQ